MHLKSIENHELIQFIVIYYLKNFRSTLPRNRKEKVIERSNNPEDW